ncbi:MAG: hypothetical protein WA814_12820 [Candidatus Baltobacteraceae bacterium]
MNVKLVVLSAGIEAVTGILLIAVPSFVSWLLFAAALPPIGELTGRVAGFALTSLAIAAWPSANAAGRNAVWGLLAYNALAAILFLYVGIRGESVGFLLWPAFALHAAMTVLFARAARSA